MLLRKLWSDELGATVSLETVLVGTVGVLAVTGGIATLADAVNDELGEMAMAVRGFNQSYSTTGYSTNGVIQTGVSRQGTSVGTTFQAFNAGSGFRQAPPNINIQQTTGQNQIDLGSGIDIGGQQSQFAQQSSSARSFSSAAASPSGATFVPPQTAVFESRNVERTVDTGVVTDSVRTNRDSGDCAKAKSY